MRLHNLLRAICRNKMVLVTNLTGLSIGLAATILLMLFVLHEWSYDRYFKNAGRIYRLNTIYISEGNKTILPINLRMAYTEIPRNVPGIENSIQIYRGSNIEIRHDEIRFSDNTLLYADSAFFKIFNFKTREGSLEHSLDDPNNIVLTQKVASKIFGDKPVTGQHLEIEGKSYNVSAVMENVPLNTHFQFDVLMPMESMNNLQQFGGLEFFTYYLLYRKDDAVSTCARIRAENTRILKDHFKEIKYDFESQTEPLLRLHLYSKASFDLSRQGNVKTIILVGAIAFMILFLALSNFINLFIMEGEKRAKEIGVRKTVGAGKINLFGQFFGEVTIVVTISFLIGLILTFIILPEFGNLMQRQFSLTLLKSPLLIASLFVIFLLTIVLSGGYPAFYLSMLKPVSMLKSEQGKSSRRKYVMNLTGSLQLIITLSLFTTLFGINREINYLKNLSPGFNPEGLVNIYNLNNKMKIQYPAIREKLLSIPEITGVAASSHTIGGGCSGQAIRLIESPEDKMMGINEYRIQPELCKLLQLTVAEGRLYDPERIADRQGVILNQAAVNKLGLTSAVGRQVVMFAKPMEIIGVVKNFRYESAAKIIQPLILTAYSEDFRTIMVRLVPGSDFGRTMKKIEDALKSFDNGYIMNARATSDIYRQYYADEDRLKKLVTFGSAVSLVIVIMGIFLLVSQNIALRTKEIGIRKVLGSTTAGMIALMYSNSFKWTLISAIIAIPAGYVYLNNWLQNYAEKASMSWWIFVSGFVIVLSMEILVTFAHIWREVTRNPVESLRYE